MRLVFAWTLINPRQVMIYAYRGLGIADCAFRLIGSFASLLRSVATVFYSIDRAEV